MAGLNGQTIGTGVVVRFLGRRIGRWLWMTATRITLEASGAPLTLRGVSLGRMTCLLVWRGHGK